MMSVNDYAEIIKDAKAAVHHSTHVIRNLQRQLMIAGGYFSGVNTTPGSYIPDPRYFWWYEGGMVSLKP